MRCPDESTLVDLSTVLEEDAPEAVRHMATCPTCLERLSVLAALRRGLLHETEPREGFAEEVVASVLTGSSSGRMVPEQRGGVHGVHGPGFDAPRPSALAGLAIEATTPLLSAACTFMAVLVAGGSVLEPGIPVLSVAVLAGAATALWNRSGTVVRDERAATA